jgi:hypothetical protein
VTDTTVAHDTAAATARAVGQLASFFMLDPATYQSGAERGFAGIDTYFAGRCGVLGDVDADVVTAALVFFPADHVRRSWDQSGTVMSRAEAVAHFTSCMERWVRDHLGNEVDWARLAELAGQIVSGATVAGAPLFAAWRTVDVPVEPVLAAVHQMNLLRELRMARHGGAVMAVGLDPGDAVRHNSPQMAGLFGWSDAEVPAEAPALWDEAEALTNRATARDYAGLSPAEATEFVSLCEAALAAVH